MFQTSLADGQQSGDGLPTPAAGNSPLTMYQMPLEPLPHLPPFRSILHLYEAKRAGRILPAWQAFNFTDFVGWHARIAVSKREGDDLRFRIFGSAFTELFARDLTGALLIDSLVPEQKRETAQHFKRCIEWPLIGLAVGSVPAVDRDFLEFQVLDLPLGDADGTVTHFLHVAGPYGRSHELRRF